MNINYAIDGESGKKKKKLDFLKQRTVAKHNSAVAIRKFSNALNNQQTDEPNRAQLLGAEWESKGFLSA